MERYEYKAAAAAFREIQSRAPGWITGTVNLSIALLNQGGEAAEKAKKSGQGEPDEEAVQNIDAARILLDGVIAREPGNPHALFSRGIILQSQGDSISAHRDFTRVTEIDPGDANAWFEFAESFTDPTREGMPPGRAQAPELISAYSKALEANPYLVTAMYGLQRAYSLAGDRDRATKTFALFKKLNTQFDPAASGEKFALVYGEMGRYAQIIDPFRRSEPPRPNPPLPRFGIAEEIKITLQPGERWVTATDLKGSLAIFRRVQDRFGAGFVTCDVNRDGLLDLYLTAAIIGPAGVRDALLLNQGNARFTDATSAYGLPLDRASLGVAAADFDADLQVDLYLTGVNDNRLFRQEHQKFVDSTQAARVAVPGMISLTARWLDIDQDGDLDLYVINHAAVTDHETALTNHPTGRGVANSVFRNDGKPAMIGFRPDDNLAPIAAAPADLAAREGLSIAFSTAWPAAETLQAGINRHTALAALDIDGDRDTDLVVAADDAPPSVLLNDRAGQFHATPLAGWAGSAAVSGLLINDVDKNGLPDLIATSTSAPVFVWQNTTERSGSVASIRGQSFPINASRWRTGITIDADLDTWFDLVGLPMRGATTGLEWSRDTGTRFQNHPIPLGPVGVDNVPWAGMTAASVVGNPLPDLIFRRDGEPPRVAENRGNGQHWLAVDLAGRWKSSHDQMRTNSEGLGAKVSVEGQGLYIPFNYTTPSAGLGQSVGPFVFGLAEHVGAPLLRTRWPDGVLQSELNVAGDKLLRLVELNRKTGSCPILFTWNNQRFVCIGDFAGAAGLGFFEAPGDYHSPDRDEAVAIGADQLRPVDSRYRLSIVEPMDEVAYLDQLQLEVVDRLPGLNIGLDERFAFGTDKPSGNLLSWSQSISLRAARDNHGCNVAEQLRLADRLTVNHFQRLQGWVGYTEDHAVDLDFGPPPAPLRPDQCLTLCLTGWVEYPYSQTNYAASGAGIALKPPVLEQRLPDGQWRLIDATMGHPAGLPRMMTVSLRDKLLPGADIVLRISTNMECYWDQAFLAVVEPPSLNSVRSVNLPVAQARLRDRGYLREYSADGHQPPLPDYHLVDPMPLARFRGELTLHGDVAELLQRDDDQLCVMGPGDEVELEFDGSHLPPLEFGWTRSFVFRSVAYCKDADPFTATSDTVGPLPWRGMAGFPLPPGRERPLDAAYSEYLRAYQTRPAGER